jgi:hypothetical protein
MAGPLIQLLQGLRGRRMRRRGGWGGGDSPSMRNIINPLDSQDMTDRAQGVDISRAMPSTRLETQISQPAAESFATSQLPQAAAPSVAAPSQVAAEFDQPAQRSSPFMTAAGSNAVANPVSTQQCPGGVCPTGPSRGLNAADYGITLSPGETLLRVNEQPSSSPAPMGAMPSSPAAPSAVGAPQPGQQPPQLTPGGWSSFVQEAAADPKKANWRGFALAAQQQQEKFTNLVGITADPKLKAVYWNESQYWGRESANAMRAAILADNLAPRQQMAEKALRGNTLGSRLEESYRFLSTPGVGLGPDDRAAAFARDADPKLAVVTDEQLKQNQLYQDAAQVAHAGEIAHFAAIAAADDPLGNPWGTEESRAAGASMAWNAATARYGAMPLEQAFSEIDKRFVPAYAQALGEANARRPEGQQLSDGEIVQKALDQGLVLRSHVYYSRNPNADREPQQPAVQTQALQQPSPQQPAAKSQEGGGWWPSVQAWGGG